jgi:hypothetical protein
MQLVSLLLLKFFLHLHILHLLQHLLFQQHKNRHRLHLLLDTFHLETHNLHYYLEKDLLKGYFLFLLYYTLLHKVLLHLFHLHLIHQVVHIA